MASTVCVLLTHIVQRTHNNLFVTTDRVLNVLCKHCKSTILQCTAFSSVLAYWTHAQMVIRSKPARVRTAFIVSCSRHVV
jgi:hypothetical protein